MASTTSQYVVSALPGQGYDTLFCPDLDELWRLPGVLIDESRDSSSPTGGKTLYPQAPPATGPGFELNIVAPRPVRDECKAFAAGSQTQASWDSQGALRSTNLRPCEEAIGQIIWPRGCRNMEHNERTAAVVSAIDRRYETSIDPLSEVKRGVSFWFARLTPDQIKALQADTIGVKAVITNPPYEFRKSNIKLSPAGVPASHKKRSRVKKRHPLRVVEQYTKDESLRFPSTAPGQLYSTIYNYFSEAGAGVNVYKYST